MTRSLKLTLIVTLAIALCAVAPFPAAAKKVKKPVHISMKGPADAVFYELTESMKLIPRELGTFRVASSALRGVADRGTPFCPNDVLTAYGITADSCTVVAVGSDDISLLTGLGTFTATIDIVIDGDNPFDGPEFVIGTLAVRGDMDFSPALFGNQYPFGTILGNIVQTDGTARRRFAGVFRLPFLGSVEIAPGFTLRNFFCPGSVPSPHLPMDFVYLDTIDGQPNGKCIDVRPEELSLDTPVVRFELWFQN